jgi:hypothetical protein
MPTLANSTFLDFTSYGTTTATTVEAAYHITGSLTSQDINVAFILPRANDPTDLLSSNWATRQTTLQQLKDSGTLWSTYGASAADYNSAHSILSSHSQILGSPTGAVDGYVTSQESRTIWVTLSPNQFETLLGTKLYQSDQKVDGDTLYYWNGSLSVPSGLNLAGLWFDTAPWFGTMPAVSDLSGGARAVVHEGPQSIGNYLSTTFQRSNYFPSVIAKDFYNFPLAGKDIPTTTVGLIEPGIGDAMPSASLTFQQGLNAYRHAAGVTGPGEYYLVGNAAAQSYATGDNGERSLDVGVIASAAPGSKIGLYSGSGFSLITHANVFTSYQTAFWDTVNNPTVLSSSFSIFPQTNPSSVFYNAVKELFIDGALRGVTMVQADNDFGSSWDIATGLANQVINSSSPFMLLIGGTSLTTIAAAPLDPTIASVPSVAQSLYGLAMSGDVTALWRLVEGGLTKLPSAAAGAEAEQNTFLEAVWNSWVISNGYRTPKLGAGDGGVDTTQPTPWYQTDFGLTPTSVNPGHATGRGAPDVSADSGGNLFYNTPNGDFTNIGGDEGTSAATPLWASLMAQVDTIFADQGLPHLGFANDLLYIAGAIAPGSFNDITFGNNVTSFINGAYAGGATVIDTDGNPVTLTGYGYFAGPGYDLTTGLGSPNGVLLARAMTAIAHSQMSFSSSPDMLDADGSGWASGADQSLMFQTMSPGVATVGLDLGTAAFSFSSAASGAYAWTNRLAQQVLQSDFDPNLVRLFDKQAQGWVGQSVVEAGEHLSVSINAQSTAALQASMTSPFDFADFTSANGAVRVARAVAVAETAGAADDTVAIVRVRQNGEDTLSLTFYMVDDLTGAIDGKRPGEAGYLAAIDGRAYQVTSGGTALNGPGYGNFGQAGLTNVDSGDLIAMKLVNQTTGAHYLAFAHANETVAGQSVGHLWNYGANTWGWEDTFGGGDRDFNDLIVQLDFTSTSGHGWLI